MNQKRLYQLLSILFVCTLLSFSIVGASPAPQQDLPETVVPDSVDEETSEPQQSTTGPTPPPAVILHDSQKPDEADRNVRAEVVISDVPYYLWRHGCGPTAVGMVVGYYDSHGFGDLVPGDASTQTADVDQIIASGGSSGSPMPPGSEGHFEDYASPIDYWPNLLEDDVITAGRTPHADNSLADYMETSMSSKGNYYGWSWSSAIQPSFVNFVNQQNPSYQTPVRSYYMGGSLNWDVLTNEIDAGRPMIFLVDTSCDGTTDHFVTVAGYRTVTTRGASGALVEQQQYGVHDTWGTTIRWENFVSMSSGVCWGVWGGWSMAVLDASLDAYEPDDNAVEANLLEKGSPQDHNIKPVGDEDWVKIDLVAPSEVILTTSGGGGDDTRMWLYDSALTEIEFNDNGGDGNYAAIDRICDVDALPAGTYYVRVDENGGDAEIASYTLSLSTSFCLAVDTYEPDDDSTQASLIESMTSQTHSLYPSGDADWLTFSVSEMSEIFLNTFGPEPADTVMYLYDSELTEIDYNDDSDWDIFSFIHRPCSEDPLPEGTYYVKVMSSPAETPIALYNISLYIDSCSRFWLQFPIVFQTGP